MKIRLPRLLVAACLALPCTIPIRLQAATLTVSNLADGGPGTLRAMLTSAVDGDMINFSVTGTILLTTGELSVPRSVSLVGPGAGVLRVSGNHAYRVFEVTGASVGIRGLTVADGQTGMSGGGIAAAGNSGSIINISDCLITNNSTLQDGGGIWNCTGVTMTISNCTVSGNSASEYGGGVCNSRSTIAIIASTVSGNTAPEGGGLMNNGQFGTATMAIIASSLRGNSANYGGAIFNNGNSGTATLTVNASTVSSNSASLSGGAVAGGAIANSGAWAGSSAALTISGSTFSGNSAGDAAISNDGRFNGAARLEIGDTILQAGAYGTNINNSGGTIASDGYNLSSDGACGFLTNTADQINTNAKLGPLQDNGGPTFTHALSADSPAVDQGKTNAVPALGRTSDQRGFIRQMDHPFFANATGGDGSDIGAFERQSLGTTFYANVSNPTPVAPYTNWATAATNIQDALNQTVAGDEVLVTDGAYQTGATVVGMSNRVAATKAVVVHSVNGPAVTTIVGSGPVGAGAVRCIYLTNGAILSGFTITNGATQSSGNVDGGGVYCASASAVVSNCVLRANSAAGGGGGVAYGTLRNCTLASNSADHGGGAAAATLINCVVTNNWASNNGGGVSGGMLISCALTNNSAPYSGGGANAATLYNCTLSGNAANQFGQGGGAASCTLSNCLLTGNYSSVSGGGAYGGTLYYCTLTGNYSAGTGGGGYSAALNNCILSANGADNQGGGASESSVLNNCLLTGNWAYYGGGACFSYLYNCTVVGNSLSGGSGAGVYGGGVYNSIVYYNSGANYAGSSGMSYCCTTPSPGGTGNFTTAPLFGNTNGWVNLRIQPGSPCINTGNNAYAPGTSDLDGNPRIIRGTVDVGAYELQSVHYVALTSCNPEAPYDSWPTAATKIQDAMDVAFAGDSIVVGDGVYQIGGRAVYGLSNRLAVTKPVTVQSLNGPALTSIVGSGPIGPAAVRCVYLTNGVLLAGFTLTNGATHSENDYSTNQCGAGVWCESLSAVVSNCVLAGNSACYRGGGAYSGTLINCALTGNSATNGASNGGGAYSSTLSNCTLTGNSATYGGGALYGILDNCALSGNSALLGGGVYNATLNNCMLTGNSGWGGGGADFGTLNNCTLTRNVASMYGGGVNYATLNNCIVYGNTAPLGGNYYNGTLNNCCTMPQPPSGSGNITADPQLISAARLSGNSPCIGAGSALYTHGVDIDGEPWANPPSIGADEYWSGSITGDLSLAIVAAYTNVAVGCTVDFQALINGRALGSSWDFGDRTVVYNQPWTSHAWTVPGTYTVALGAYNLSHPGVVAQATVQVVAQPVHFVSATSANPVPPYASWATAATNMQDAVDTALPGALIWVSNGVYRTGGRTVSGLSNRVAVTKPMLLRSVNGPGVTTIVGAGPGGPTAVRCVYLGAGGLLAGFTLTNGFTQVSGADAIESGGGVWCESTSAVVSNCVLTGNSAFGSGGGGYSGTLDNCVLSGNSANDHGGGAFGSTLNNCTLTTNSSSSSGGGACYAALNNCTVSGNSTPNSAGGVDFGTLTNCIIYYNTAPSGSNCGDCTLSYCCTTPLASGIGNFTADPQLFDTNRWSNLRLQPGSPCVNSGANAYAAGTIDLDGYARISGGQVDVGAYEFQPVHYVTLTSSNAVAPYNSWTTAATNIQSAVGAAAPGDDVVVSDGVYQTGAQAVYGMSSRVAVTKPVRVRSVNGPTVTSIVGSGPNGPAAVRCVYLTNGAMLAGFTLTNGATQTSGNSYTNESGGAVWCESSSAVVSNCVVTGSSASYAGGAVYLGGLFNCALMGNSAPYGGGAYASLLLNCTVVGNSGFSGGGAYASTLTNCIAYYNSALSEPNYFSSTLQYCCTTPLPPSGAGNFTTAPLLVNSNGWCNLRLQAGSPCIDAGYGACPAGLTDLDCNPRISGGNVDVGAYEYQFDPFHWWLAQRGLPYDGSADSADPDHDGLNNRQEWLAGTEPTNAASVLWMRSAKGGVGGVTVTWSSVTNRTYALERAIDLGALPSFSVLRGNIAGSPGTTSYTDTNAPASGPRFYRVRVEN